MTGNKIFMKIILICMVMALCLICCMTEVKAIEGVDILQQYQADPDAFQDTVDSLSKEEAEDWLKKVKEYEKILRESDLQSDNSLQWILDKFGIGDGNPNDKALSAVEKIKNILTDRIRELEGKEQEGKLDEDEMKKWSFEEIRDWINKNDPEAAGISSDLKDAWIETIENTDDIDDQTKEEYIGRVNGESISDQNNEKVDEAYDTAESPIYNYPTKLGSNDNAEESLEEVITDGNRFTSTGKLKLDPDNLQNFSRTMYNILLAVGVAVAVIVGAIIGIKLMVAPIEEKAEAKKLLVPYVAGCVIVFAGFGIWQLVVTILQGI